MATTSGHVTYLVVIIEMECIEVQSINWHWSRQLQNK